MSWPDNNNTSSQGVTSPYADTSSLVTDNDGLGNGLGSLRIDINDNDLPANKPHLLYLSLIHI